ncbi:MAG: hypothetical protein KBS74_08950 [Clostridiales bacterium]|nr:hypothetical protein [Candidatus Cacconaster stercorequi]
MKKMNIWAITLCVAVLTVLLSVPGISAFAADDVPQWVGPDDVEIHHGDVTNYVSKDGTYSAEIPADGIAWIYYSTSFDRFWIGIDNPDGVFEEGSRFHVRWSADDSSGHEDIGIISDRSDRRVNDLTLLEMGVERPDGTAYRVLDRKVSLYLQPADCVDDRMAFSVYADEGYDEIMDTRIVRMMTPDGAETTLIDLRLTHPDTQLHFEWKTSLWASAFSEHEPLILCLGAAVVLAVTTVILVRRKKKGTSRTSR